MVSRDYAVKTVKAFIEACAQSKIFFNKVMIFGSVASGTNNKNSDIDVAFVSDQFKGYPLADWHLLSPINVRFPEIEPHPYSTEYFNTGDPLIEEIIKTGFEVI